MIALGLVPLLVGLAAAAGVPRVAGRLQPASATVLLTALALTVSLASGLVLSLAGYVALREVLPQGLPAATADVLRDDVPLPPAVGYAAGVVAAVLLARAGSHLARAAAGWRRVTGAARRLPSVGDLAIVEDGAPHAYAVPGRYRRIVVSTGLLRQLSGPQRTALLAHEEAHLRCHHHLYVQLARIAAAANPLMRPVSRVVDGCVERWADEAAARSVGDRATVAGALAAAAIAATRPAPAAGLSAAQDGVVDRVRMLLEPPARYLRMSAVLVWAGALCWASTATVVLYVHRIVEIAEAAAH